jgi:hypothetical protein
VNPEYPNYQIRSSHKMKTQRGSRSMKALILIALIFGGSLKALANETAILTSDELHSLKDEAQARYLKSVQKILAEMTKKTLYMASKGKTSGTRMPASTLFEIEQRKSSGPVTDLRGSATADPGQPSSGDEDNKVTLDSLIAKQEKKEAREKRKGIRIREIVEDPSSSSSQPTAAAVAPQGASTTSAVSNDNPSEPIESKETTKKTEIELTEKAIASNSKKAHRKSEDIPIDGSKEADEIDKKMIASNEKKKPVVEKNVIEKKEGNFFRCMHSGWVVEEEPCKAQETFPEGYTIEGVDMSKMKCPGQTMCNPTLFGLRLTKPCIKFADCENTAKPLCVSRGAWPTADCYKMSTFEDTLVAVEIGKKNKQLVDDYSQKFSQLCDKDNIAANPFADTKNGKPRSKKEAQYIRNDITLTCGWADAQLKAAKEAILIDKNLAPGKDPGTSKWNQDKTNEYKLLKEKEKANGAGQN